MDELRQPFQLSDSRVGTGQELNRPWGEFEVTRDASRAEVVKGPLLARFALDGAEACGRELARLHAMSLPSERALDLECLATSSS